MNVSFDNTNIRIHTVHSKEEIYERLVRNDVRVECDLDCLRMACSFGTDLVVRRFCGGSASVADNNLVELVWKMLTIELFGA